MTSNRAGFGTLFVSSVAMLFIACGSGAKSTPPDGSSSAADGGATTGDGGGLVADAGAPLVVQVLAINDFHGHLEAPVVSAGSPELGGAEYLAAHIRSARAANPNTIFVSAGDLFGNTPFLSAWFHDEDTVEVMGLMGLDLHAVG